MWSVHNLGYHYSYLFLSGVAAVLLAVSIALPDWVIRGPIIENTEAVIYKDGLWRTCRYTGKQKNCYSSNFLNKTENRELQSWTGPVSAFMVAGFIATLLGVSEMMRRLWNVMLPSQIEIGLPVVLTAVGTFSSFLSLEIHTDQASELCEEHWRHYFDFGTAYRVGWAGFVFGLWSFAPLLIRLADSSNRKKKKELKESLKSAAFNITPSSPYSI